MNKLRKLDTILRNDFPIVICRRLVNENLELLKEEFSEKEFFNYDTFFIKIKKDEIMMAFYFVNGHDEAIRLINSIWSENQLRKNKKDIHLTCEL